MSRSQDLVILLGAGASAEADIPPSALMIDSLEKQLSSDAVWQEYLTLYYHIKSSIYYSSGLRGLFNEAVSYNIEILVNTLTELERNEVHTIYPFIASWNSRFIDLAGADFDRVRSLRTLILDKLKDWMCPENDSLSSYYQGFRDLQRHINFPLKVFTLNYDLCMESIEDSDFRVETGFPEYGPGHVWDYERFNDGPPDGDPLPEVFLYKLHGSINWKRDDKKRLYQVKQVQSVDSSAMELIFGREFKLEAADPYLFYTYEFRRLTASARLVLAIGYGFADDHINKLLTQAMRIHSGPRMLIITETDNITDFKMRIEELLEVSEKNRIEVVSGGAKEFLSSSSIGQQIAERIPTDDDPFDGIQ